MFRSHRLGYSLSRSKMFLVALLFLAATVAQAAETKITLNMEGNLNDTSGNDLVTLGHGGFSFVAGGISGQALSLDGTGYLELPFDLLSGSADFTVDFWFRTTTRGGLLGYQATAYPTSPVDWIPIIAVGSDGKLRTEFWTTSSGGVSISSPGIVNDGAWHRVVLTADATNQNYNVFLDGTSLGSASAEINHLLMNFNQLGVANGGGRTPLVQGWDFFEGQVDQFVLYAEAVPASEVSKTAQFVTFTALPDRYSNDNDVSLNATSDSGLTVSYTSADASICTASGSTVQLLANGTCTLTASQSGDATYSAASPVSRSFEITAPSNTAPRATASQVDVVVSSALSINLAGVDDENDSLSYVVVSQPLHGVLSGAAPSLLYTPTIGYIGADSFTFKVNDTLLDSVVVSVDITVSTLPLVLTLLDDNLAVGFEQTRIVDVLANDLVENNGAMTLLSLTQPAAGQTEITTEGNIRFTAPTGASGLYSFDYTVQAEDNTTASATVNVTVVAAPAITAPADIVLDATALYSRVELGNATALDAQGLVLAAHPMTDNIFRPGRHWVIWQTEDAHGVSSEDTQRVDVRPLVSFQKDQIISEGKDVRVEVELNGEAPSYPLTVSYTVGGSAGASDHDLVDGQLVIAAGKVGYIDFSILSDSIAESQESVVLSLVDEAAVNLGFRVQHTITISEENIAPLASLQVNQNSEDRHTVGQQDGTVTVVSTVTDANAGQSLLYDWSRSDNALVNLSIDPAEFVFDPTGVEAGVYSVVLAVTDDGSPAKSATAKTFVKVVPALVVLNVGEDSDGDGVLDTVEGLSDTDSDGIPDYLDNNDQCNVLPQQLSTAEGYLVEADPGVCLRIGHFAMSGETGGSQLVDQDIDKTTEDALVPDTEAENVGGVFDFLVTDLPLQGQVVNVVIPQRVAIPENAVYRKLKSGLWVGFASDAKNRVQSTVGEAGYCPPPESAAWTDGLTAGDWCVQLSIVDGGLNDDDNEANQMIVDPGGVAVMGANTGALTDNSTYRIKGAGSLAPWFLVFLSLFVAAKNSRKSKQICAVLFSIAALAAYPLSAKASGGHAAQAGATHQQSQWYLSALGGYFDDRESTATLQGELIAQGNDGTVVSTESSHFALELALGYQVNHLVGLELGFVDLGEPEVIVEFPDQPALSILDDTVIVHPNAARGVVVQLRFGERKKDKLMPYGKLGLWRWNSDFELLDSNGVKQSKHSRSGSDWVAAVGLTYMTSVHFGLSYEHSYLHFGGNQATNISIGLVKEF